MGSALRRQHRLRQKRIKMAFLIFACVALIVVSATEGKVGPNGSPSCYRLGGKGHIKITFTRENGVDRPGNDIKGKAPTKVQNFKSCVALCESIVGCVAITYVQNKRNCWPKHAWGNPVPKAGHVSATFERNDGFGCSLCRAKAYMLDMGGFDIPIPSCEIDTSFSAKQCHDNKCWCVAKNGEEITKRVDSKKALNCAKERAKLVKPTKCQKMASTKDPKKFKPSCKPNGDFQAKQCLPAVIAGAAGTHCWCSLKNGKIIPDTIHSSATFPKYNCDRHADLTYDDVCKKPFTTVVHPFDERRFVYCAYKRAYACSCPQGLKFSKTKPLVCTM